LIFEDDEKFSGALLAQKMAQKNAGLCSEE
jgi:hypothetical protein